MLIAQNSREALISTWSLVLWSRGGSYEKRSSYRFIWEQTNPQTGRAWNVYRKTQNYGDNSQWKYMIGPNVMGKTENIKCKCAAEFLLGAVE